MNRSKLGVIDALGLGFELVARAAWILLIPIALDLFLWLGPRLSVRRQVDALIGLLGEQVARDPRSAQINVDNMRAILSELGNSINLFSLLATDFVAGRFLPVPTIMSSDYGSPTASVLAGSPPSISLVSGWQVLLVSTLLFPIGLLIGTVFMMLITDRLDGGSVRKPIAGRAFSAWLAYLRLAIAAGLLLGVCSIPFGVVIGVAALLQPVLGMVVLLAGWMLAIWVGLYAWFAIYAIAGGEGVMRALWMSAIIVQRNFTSVLWLILLSFLLSAAVAIVASWLEVSLVGTLLAIAVNAFIGSSLAAAAAVFYHDRVMSR